MRVLSTTVFHQFLITNYDLLRAFKDYAPSHWFKIYTLQRVELIYLLWRVLTIYTFRRILYVYTLQRICLYGWESRIMELVRSPRQLGNALRRFRRERLLTQIQLAKRTGLRQGTISQVENGLETVKLNTVMDLLRALDLEIVLQPRTKGSQKDIEELF
jgi:HTH-type transcriptional regulator/antitoxin HipB